MDEKLLEEYYAKVSKIEKRCNKSILRDYSKQKVLDYDKFISEVNLFKNRYPEATDFYDLLILFSESNKQVIESKKDILSSKGLAIFEYACTKAIKNEIDGAKSFGYIVDHSFETSYQIQRQTGIDCTQAIFFNCLKAQIKVQENENNEQTM